MKLSKICAAFLCIVTLCDSAHILMFMILASKSHKHVFWPLAKELAHRAHHVTIFSPFPKSEEVERIQEVNPSKFIAFFNTFIQDDQFQKKYEENNMLRIMKHAIMSPDLCKLVLDSPETKLIMKPAQPVDLIIIDGLMNDCGLGFAYMLKSPFVYLNTAGFYTWQADPTGNPYFLSAVPQLVLPYTDEMSFYERLMNAMVTWGTVLTYQFYTLPHLEALFHRLAEPHMPTFAEIQKNTSLVFMNSHFSNEYPRPLLPTFVEVGGMHCRPAQSIPKDIAEFVESSGDDGFILFSFGSVVQAKFMPEKIRKTFLQVFSQLPTKVLWKWETETMDDLPSNVKLMKWLPQQDILGHAKCRMFITHGGLLGQQEAIYHKVPMLVIPFFGDQEANAVRASSLGYAIHMDLSEINTQSLTLAIKRLMEEPSFQEKINKVSRIYWDQLQTPLERAVYWTEYVIRHEGAPHLRSAARNLSWYQYYLLDVAIFLLIVFTATIGLIYYILKKVIRFWFKRAQSKI